MSSISDNNVLSVQYCFIHLSFQEYFAGQYYAKELINQTSNIENFLLSTQYSNVHRLMWQFTFSGLYQCYKATNDEKPLLSFWGIVLRISLYYIKYEVLYRTILVF